MTRKRLDRRDVLRALGWGLVSGLAAAGVALLWCRGQFRLSPPGPTTPSPRCPTCPLRGGCFSPSESRSPDGRP